jgi:hypothetical protein
LRQIFSKLILKESKLTLALATTSSSSACTKSISVTEGEARD